MSVNDLFSRARHQAPGDKHLSSLLSAYVDNQLSDADADCVEGHLLVCEECASAVAEIRRIRGILATPPIVDPSSRLLEKLSLIDEASTADASQPRSAKWSNKLFIAAVGLAASLVALSVLGTYDLPNVSGNVAQRAQNSLLDNRSRAANFLVASAELAQTGDLEPQLRNLANSHVDLEILAVNREQERDEFEVIMRMQASDVVVRERRGKLPMGDSAPGTATQVSGYEVQVISEAPWTAVWQRGESVVSVAADAPYDTIERVIEAIPPEPLDEGISARVVRGVQQIGHVIGN